MEKDQKESMKMARGLKPSLGLVGRKDSFIVNSANSAQFIEHITMLYSNEENKSKTTRKGSTGAAKQSISEYR